MSVQFVSAGKQHIVSHQCLHTVLEEMLSAKMNFCGFIALQIALSEDDLTVIMKILLENLGGASSQPNTVQENIEDTQILKKGKAPHESRVSDGMFSSRAEYV